jgi:hypothetical protein
MLCVRVLRDVTLILGVPNRTVLFALIIVVAASMLGEGVLVECPINMCHLLGMLVLGGSLG